ncbi:MAG: translation initiation factor IF-2 [Phycisphaerae bacterium]|nr:translation initiation factor IF-2 [Phycisphaerae bacterium]
MAARVFELAHQIGVTSKQILAKCRAEGLDIKNHMTALSAGLEATIREWFSEGAHATAVETAEQVDLTTAREEASKARHRRKRPEAKEKPAEEAAPAAVAEAPAAVEPAGVAPAAPPVEPAPPPPPLAEPRVAAEAAPEAPEAEEGEPGQRRRPRPWRRPPPTPVKPAGPQVVPKPAAMKGPRVVRVEKPELMLGRGPRAPGPGPVAPPAPVTVGGRHGGKLLVPEVGEDEEVDKKKGKRRSPRRRGGRTADSGERLVEWRDQDLAERSQRLAAATGGTLRRHRAGLVAKPTEMHIGYRAGPVEIEEPITVKSLAAATGIKAADLLRKLMELGVMATVNQVLERDAAEAAVVDHHLELVIKQPWSGENDLRELLESRAKGELAPRAPVVTFLGHVDHGKTSLLDRIRNAAVAAGEAGGITQHIGAYRYDVGGKRVVFLDTPGHEAFTAMRARGANMTDVVVLVVAADDGVMPQTVEAISHARAAGVPIVIALNKIDMPNANATRAIGQLAEHNLVSREWGGNVEVIQTSAVTGAGIDKLLETLSLEAELLELRAEKDAPAEGFVIEAQMSPTMGVIARLLVRNGSLKVGDMLLAGAGFGRVRQMSDDRGRSLDEAGPSTPVEVAWLDDVPQAGDRFCVLPDLDLARLVAEERRAGARTESLSAGRKVTLETLLSQIQAGQRHELAAIVKADVQGSLEALKGSLGKLSTDEVHLNLMHTGVGGISTGDVTLAEASGAIIVGFNVVPDAAARQLAESPGVDIRLYRVIYDLLEDVRKALAEGLAPEIREEVIGHAQVRAIFKISRVGTVAGCYITDGLVSRNASVRITRNNIVIEDGRSLASLRRFKDDVREVRAGMECGLKIEGYDDVKESDGLEFYQQVEVARQL